MDKAKLKEARQTFDLHCLLIQRDGVPLATSRVMAYAEGEEGLQARLNPVPKALVKPAA